MGQSRTALTVALLCILLWNSAFIATKVTGCPLQLGIGYVDRTNVPPLDDPRAFPCQQRE